MAVTSGFFDSRNGDRKYNADQMSEYFRGIVSGGVFQHLDGGLQVTAGTGLSVNVAAGRAIVQNRWVQNSASLPLSISAASETYGRKDAVVLRLDSSARTVSIVVKTGTPAASPAAPSMTRSGGVYEMALAYVNVAAGATSVTITDKRSDSAVCGWAAVAQATSGEVDQMLDDMKTGFDGVVYSSPAAMVQGCDSKLQNTDYFFGKWQIFPTFSAGFIRPSTLEVVTSGTGDHLISDAFLIPAMTIVYVPCVNKSMSTTLLCECNQSGTPTKLIFNGTATANSDGRHIKYIATEDTYVRFSGNKTMSEYMTFFLEKFDKDIQYDLSTFREFNTNNTIGSANGPIISTGISSGGQYRHTKYNLMLPKGMTIEFWDSGSTSNVALSEFNADGEIVQPLMSSNNYIQHREYTATENMNVRLSSRNYAQKSDTTYYATLPSAKWASWRVYYKGLHFDKNSSLYEKHLTVMGDSLVYGNGLRPGPTWITTIGLKYNMIYTNLGDNGDTVASYNEGASGMVNRLSSIPDTTEIFVLEGGANDRRLNIPLGEENSTDPTTFNGALNVIVAYVREHCPKAKILLMTTYHRFNTKNSLNLTEIDYVDAMIAGGARNNVLVYDNWRNSGVDFTNEYFDNWADECWDEQRNDSEGNVYYKDPTHHFNIASYDWLVPIYEQLLNGL